MELEGREVCLTTRPAKHAFGIPFVCACVSRGGCFMVSCYMQMLFLVYRYSYQGPLIVRVAYFARNILNISCMPEMYCHCKVTYTRVLL